MKAFRNKLARSIVKDDTDKAVMHGNGYATACTQAVLAALNVKARYSQCPRDCVDALRRHGYPVRSRNTAFLRSRKGRTVTQLKAMLSDYSDPEFRLCCFYLVHVDGHVLLLGSGGQVEVDTAPRNGDRRKVKNVWLIALRK